MSCEGRRRNWGEQKFYEGTIFVCINSGTNLGWPGFWCCFLDKQRVMDVWNHFQTKLTSKKIASSSKWMGAVKIKHVGSIKVINPFAAVVYYCCFTNPSGGTKLVGTYSAIHFLIFHHSTSSNNYSPPAYPDPLASLPAVFQINSSILPLLHCHQRLLHQIKSILLIRLKLKLPLKLLFLLLPPRFSDDI